MNDSKGAVSAPFFISPKGFSLVELMVVVAIIGLLSAVAIPNFQKFQARSRTTEAKLQLAAVYTAEASFFGTYQIYHNCLMYMGYDPVEYRISRFYAIGFTNAVAIDPAPYNSAVGLSLSATECASNLAPAENVTFFSAGSGVGDFTATSSYIPPTSVGDQTNPNMTFTAGAGGVIHKEFTSAASSSAFTINERKKIDTVRIGY